MQLVADLSLTRRPQWAIEQQGATDGGEPARFMTARLHAVALNTALPALGDPPGDAPAIPPTAPRSDRMLTLEVSAWSVGSMPWVLHRSGLLNLTVDPTMVPTSSPIQLRTANPTWLLIAPQLWTLHPDRDMVVVARSAGLKSSDAGAPRVAIANGSKHPNAILITI